MPVEKFGTGSIRWEPDSWWVCFHERTDRSWADRLIWGRFKHVCALGRVPGPNVWVFVEHCMGALHVEALPEADEKLVGERMAAMVRGATVVAMPRGFGDVPRLRPLMSCVSVTAHLLGIRSSALRPDGLFRDCLRLGGQILGAAGDEDGRTEAGSEPCCGAQA